MNKNTSLFIIAIIFLVVVATCVIVIKLNNNNTNKDRSILDVINSQFNFGTSQYDVMLGGQRNDKTAGGGSSNGGFLSTIMTAVSKDSTQTAE